MNILLTGSTGFLGERVLRHLLFNDHNVIPFMGNILRSSVHGNEFDAAVHLVGLNDATCKKNPVYAYDVNVTGTHNLLASLKERCKKVIYFSSIHSYGYPASGTITEQTPVNPESAYAMSHYLAERLILQHPGGTVLRLSNGFGCPASYDRRTAWIVVLNAICKQAIGNGSITLAVDINESRNFITATDICGAVSHFINTPHRGVFNVGGNKASRIVDMAERVADRCSALYGFRPAVTYCNDEKSSGPVLDYRIDKLKESGFTPLDNYDEEIDNTLRLCVQNKEEYYGVVGVSAVRV